VELSVHLRSFEAADPGDWRHVVAAAKVLDQAGVDRLLIPDHIAFGERLDEYGRPELGGQAGGVQPTGPDGCWLEPLTTLAVIAGATTRVRLGTQILLAALRRPAVLAKSAATLDVLSGGRLDLGVGVGWQREEYEAAGLDFQDRGRLLEHSLEVCQLLWQETRATYHSPELQFEAIHAMPKPAQAGGVPLWISGTVNPRVVRRIAPFGMRWIPWGDSAADLAAAIPRLKSALRDLGEDPDSLQVRAPLPTRKRDDGSTDLDATMAGVLELAALGATDISASLPIDRDSAVALSEITAAVAAFRAVAGDLSAPGVAGATLSAD